MGMVIKDILDTHVLEILTSNFDLTMIKTQQETVIGAAKELVKTIKSLELYPSHQELITRFEPIPKNYPSQYAHRTFYTWQMTQAGFQLTSLNLSDADFFQSNSLKCLASFISVVLDDICDLGRDRAVFDKCVLALEGKIDPDKVELCQFIADTWSVVQSTIQQAPNYLLLKNLLEEAYEEWIRSFRYSLWLQESFRLDEKWEKRLEGIAHTSLLYLAGLIDLLYVPNLSIHQASSAAQVFLRTQKMVQLANWGTTWRRELAQRDFTSGIFSMALENGWIEINDLENESLDKIWQKIQKSPAEDYLWNECKRLRVESLQIVKETHLPALEGYVDSLSPIMLLYIVSVQEFTSYQQQ